MYVACCRIDGVRHKNSSEIYHTLCPVAYHEKKKIIERYIKNMYKYNGERLVAGKVSSKIALSDPEFCELYLSKIRKKEYIQSGYETLLLMSIDVPSNISKLIDLTKTLDDHVKFSNLSIEDRNSLANIKKELNTIIYKENHIHVPTLTKLKEMREDIEMMRNKIDDPRQ